MNTKEQFAIINKRFVEVQRKYIAAGVKMTISSQFMDAMRGQKEKYTKYGRNTYPFSAMKYAQLMGELETTEKDLERYLQNKKWDIQQTQPQVEKITAMLETTDLENVEVSVKAENGVWVYRMKAISNLYNENEIVQAQFHNFIHALQWAYTRADNLADYAEENNLLLPFEAMPNNRYLEYDRSAYAKANSESQ